jgi:hypothetical protein
MFFLFRNLSQQLRLMKHSISTAIHYVNILFRYIVPHWQAIIKSNNGQKKKDKRTNNDLQNNTRKTKDRAALASLKTRLNSGSLVGEAVPAPLH